MPSATSLFPKQVKPRGLSPLHRWQSTLYLVQQQHPLLMLISRYPTFGTSTWWLQFQKDLKRMHMGRGRGFLKGFKTFLWAELWTKLCWMQKGLNLPRRERRQWRTFDFTRLSSTSDSLIRCWYLLSLNMMSGHHPLSWPPSGSGSLGLGWNNND